MGSAAGTSSPEGQAAGRASSGGTAGAGRPGNFLPVSVTIAGAPLTKTPAPNPETDVKPACHVVLGAADIIV